MVIPFRGAARLLEEQLTAMTRQSFSGWWEVIVVDNLSSMDTDSLVGGFVSQLPLIRTVAASDRCGPAHARNVGASAAGGDWLFFCDADDVCADDWLEELAAAATNCDLVGGRLEYQRLMNGMPWPGEGLDAPKLFGRIYSFSTANLAVRRTAFEELGGFDERFDDIGAAEDVDFCWRSQQAGLRFDFGPNAVVDYRMPASVGAFARQQYRFGRGEVAFVFKPGNEGLARVACRYELRRFGYLMRHATD